MIVNVNPYDTGFDENAHVMRFAALAREVTTAPAGTPIRAVVKNAPPLPTPRESQVVPHRRQVVLSTGGRGGKKVSEAHLEIVEGELGRCSELNHIDQGDISQRTRNQTKIIMNRQTFSWKHCLTKSNNYERRYVRDLRTISYTYNSVSALRIRDEMRNHRSGDSRRSDAGDGNANDENGAHVLQANDAHCGY